MPVLIDATSLLLRSAGVKSYTYNWLRSLRQIAEPSEIKAFPFLNGLGRFTHEESVLSPLETYPRLAMLYAVNAPGNPMLEWIAARADVFHVSNQLRRNIPKRPKITATIHDLTCWLMPELHTAANVRADRFFAEHTLKRADGLIAVSENTRQDAIRILGIAPEKIVTIYSGVPDDYFDAVPAERSKPYVLFVGTIEPRKNLEALLDAWAGMRYRNDFDLLIAGPAGWSSERIMARLAAGEPGVHYLGYVPEMEMPSLTAGATAFVYPSLYEGFGFPIAQAMAAGVPVITSNTSCLPEIAGEGALFVDPRSVGELRGAMEKLLESASLRLELAAQGRLRAMRFRWETCARESLAFFRRV
ncbi:MAG: glycosyltransferase family 1 protein [Bryobacteraceae bacterium]|jgi:glycosyltransferase involved in cell wall biosynthesis